MPRPAADRLLDAQRLMTGSMPGSAASTRLTCSFGPAPNPTAAPLNSLALVPPPQWVMQYFQAKDDFGLPVRPGSFSMFAFDLAHTQRLCGESKALAVNFWIRLLSTDAWGTAPGFTGNENMKKLILAAAAGALVLTAAIPALAQAPAAPAAKPAAGKINFATTKINDLIKDPKAKAIIEKAIPMIADYYDQIGDMTPDRRDPAEPGLRRSQAQGNASRVRQGLDRSPSTRAVSKARRPANCG